MFDRRASKRGGGGGGAVERKLLLNFLQTNRLKLTFCLFDSFFNSLWHFRGFTVPPADPSVSVADDDQRRKAESTTALDHTGTTANLNHVLSRFLSISQWIRTVGSESCGGCAARRADICSSSRINVVEIASPCASWWGFRNAIAPTSKRPSRQSSSVRGD